MPAGPLETYQKVQEPYLHVAGSKFPSTPCHRITARLYIYPIPSTSSHQLGLVIVGATLAEWKLLALSSYQTNWKAFSHGFSSTPRGKAGVGPFVILSFFSNFPFVISESWEDTDTCPPSLNNHHLDVEENSVNFVDAHYRIQTLITHPRPPSLSSTYSNHH